MTCHFCSASAKKFGTYGPKKIQRYRCLHCGKTFTSAEKLEGMYTSQEKAVQIINLLVEGVGINAAARLAGVHKETVLKVLEMAGERCAALMDTRIRNIKTRQVQADEIWSFCYCKEREIKEGMNPEVVGDQWTYVAIDRDTKLVISFFVGKRTFGNTQIFTDDLSNRLSSRIQLSTDGYLGYKDTVDASFGGAIDYGQLVKVYETRDGQRGRFGVPECIAAIPTTMMGNPDKDMICTSHVERSNLSMRTFMRRLTRLCLGFSKKLANLKHAVALYFAWYNFVRVHGSLKVTPAMEASITDHVWTLGELISA